MTGGEGSSQGGTPGRSSSRVKLRKRKLFSANATGIDLEDIPLESDYKGPHVKFPMTLQNLQELIDGFKGRKVNVKFWHSCFLSPFSKNTIYVDSYA